MRYQFETTNLKVSDVLKVRINIDSKYKWGSGWSSEDAAEFDKTIYNELSKNGYKIVYSDSSWSSPSLITNYNGELYLHPMEFTGFLKKSDIEKVVNILNKFPEVCSLVNVVTKEVYDLPDYEYEKLLIKNSSFINEWIENNPSKDAFDFAEEFRISRVGESTGYCSSDIDIKFVDYFIRVKNQLKACR